MKRYSRDDRINAKVHELVSKGWQVKTGGEHPKLIAPAGKPSICFAVTPSCKRNALNWLTRLRRITTTEGASTC